jgi:CHAT domain-containing protein
MPRNPPVRIFPAVFAAAAIIFTPAATLAQPMPNWYKPLYQGEYAQIVTSLEKEVLNQPKPRSAKLLPLCIAYTRLQQFGKAIACFERLDAGVSAGDVDAFEQDVPPYIIFAYGMTWCFNCTEKRGAEGNRGTVAVPMHMARAELHLALRQYESAIFAANEYLKGLPRIYAQNDNFKGLFQTQPIALMGIAYALSGNRQAAEKAIKALEEIKVRAAETQKYYGIARIHLALGEFQKAHQLLGSYDVPTVPWLDLLLGSRGDAAHKLLPVRFLKHKTQLEVGEIAPSKAGFDSLLAEPNLKENGEIHWMCLYDRGRIAAREGNLPAAIEFWKRAVEVIEQQRSTINSEAAKIGFVGDKQAVYRSLVEALFVINQHAEAFDFVERSKARALVDLLAGKDDFAVAAPEPEKIRAFLASAYASELDSRAPVPVQESMRSAQARSAAITAVREKAADLASLVSVSSVPIAEIQARLPEDEALIEYYYDDKSLYAFVLTREGMRAAKLDAAGLEAEVRALRRAIETPAGGEHEQIARQAYARLVRPLESLGLRKKLLVVPHGALHYLPFAALRDDAGYLIERYSLRFLPSASVIRYLRAGGAAGRAGVLAFGNPDLGNAMLDLKFAEEEAMTIAQKIPQSRALLRKEATETAFREYAAGFNYLHFATHGEFNADAPLRSALRLARDERSDGLLTVDRLYSTRIDADMVTLSACETGLGKLANGDDVVGLTRGFLYAGASTVVASLWKVDDRATATLMTRFYDELKSGDRREALRAAQLATKAQFPHPFFWAAFQLTGEAR